MTLLHLQTLRMSSAMSATSVWCWPCHLLLTHENMRLSCCRTWPAHPRLELHKLWHWHVDLIGLYFGSSTSCQNQSDALHFKHIELVTHRPCQWPTFTAVYYIVAITKSERVSHLIYKVTRCNTLIFSGGCGYGPDRHHRHWYSTFAPFPDTCPP